MRRHLTGSAGNRAGRAGLDARSASHAFFFLDVIAVEPCAFCGVANLIYNVPLAVLMGTEPLVLATRAPKVRD